MGTAVVVAQLYAGDLLGEAPVWDSRRQRPVWSDITSEVDYQYRVAAAEKATLHSAVSAFGLLLNSAGALISCGPAGLQYLDPDAGSQRLAMSGVTFGGPDLDELYVTKASEPLVSALSPPGYDCAAVPHGGPLYRVRTGISGRPDGVVGLIAPEQSS